jgi:hydroxymethylpyrimidine/phosphomethylpyrimidine kinase
LVGSTADRPTIKAEWNLRTAATNSNPLAICVAGFDPTGGAGLLADVAALTVTGVRAAGVVTAMTRQRPNAPVEMMPADPEEVGANLRTLLADFRPAVIKLGMLAGGAVAAAVADALKETDAPLVIDPVLSAGAGGELTDEATRRVLVERLMPQALLVTPNAVEAGRLTGWRVDSVDAMISAAKTLRETGARYVLIKGGHVDGELVDVLVGPSGVVKLARARLPLTREVHGTGCTLAALATGWIAQGRPVDEAVREAVAWVGTGIEGAFAPSKKGWMFLGPLGPKR